MSISRRLPSDGAELSEGLFLQWDTAFWEKRAAFVHKCLCDFSSSFKAPHLSCSVNWSVPSHTTNLLAIELAGEVFTHSHTQLTSTLPHCALHVAVPCENNPHSLPFYCSGSEHGDRLSQQSEGWQGADICGSQQRRASSGFPLFPCPYHASYVAA